MNRTIIHAVTLDMTFSLHKLEILTFDEWFGLKRYEFYDHYDHFKKEDNR